MHTSEVESPGEGAPTSRHRADKMSLVSTATSRSELGCRSRYLLFLNLEDGGKSGHAMRGGVVIGASARQRL